MSRSFTVRKLAIPGINSLPPSIPLVLPNNGTYDLAKNELSSKITESRSTLKVLPEALMMLGSIEKPVAVVSVCGPCRTGKSYILSRLLGSADAFALGHTMDPKTFGIWIGTSALEFDEFTVVLLDTEGIDNVEAKTRDDVSILVLSVLLSSCLIYNSVGVPRKGDLQRMEQFIKIATSVIVKQGDGIDESDSHPKDSLANHFPDFVWLLRDVHLTPTGKDGKKVTPTEYLTEIVLCRGRGFVESKEEQVARAIMTSFPSVKCVALRAPSTDPEVMQNIASRQESLDPRFNREVEDFVQQLCESVKPKHGYCIVDQISGPLLAEMVDKYVIIVNDPNAIPCISDVWSASIESVCRKKMEQLAMEYDSEMSVAISRIGMPMEEDGNCDKEDPTTLLGIHRRVLQLKTSALLNQVGHFLSSSDSGQTIEQITTALERTIATFEESPVSEPHWGSVLVQKKIVGGILKKYADQNYKMSQDTCRTVFETLYKPIREKTELNDDGKYTFEMLIQDLNTLENEYCMKAIGPAKWDVYKEKKEYVEQNNDTFENLLDYKQKAFEEAQRAAELDAMNCRYAKKIKSLAEQMNREQDSNEKKLLELQELHRDELRRMEKLIANRMKAECKLMDELTKANMKETAERVRKNEELIEAQRKQFEAKMMKINEDYSAKLKEIENWRRSHHFTSWDSEEGGARVCTIL